MLCLLFIVGLFTVISRFCTLLGASRYSVRCFEDDMNLSKLVKGQSLYSEACSVKNATIKMVFIGNGKNYMFRPIAAMFRF